MATSGLLLLDNSAFARQRTAAVRAAVHRYIDVSLFGLCSVLVQRTEIGVSARNPTHHAEMMQLLNALPMLDSDSPAVRATAQQLQSALVAAGRHRGPNVVDLLIAATAVVHEATVLHYDADYDTIAAVEPRLSAAWIVQRGSVP